MIEAITAKIKKSYHSNVVPALEAITIVRKSLGDVECNEGDDTFVSSFLADTMTSYCAGEKGHFGHNHL
jgi:hypothetical protein